MRKARIGIAIAAGTLLAAASLAGGPPAISTLDAPATSGGRAADITIDNFSFSSPTMTVAAGTEVTWVNRDDMPHTVVSVAKTFASPVLDTGERFSYRFATPGTYEYYCSIHPRMVGTVVVTAEKK
jgi:plastocyanin